MISIVVGTFRKDSISSLLGQHILKIFKSQTDEVQFIDLKDLPDTAFISTSYQKKDELTQEKLSHITQSKKIYFIVPEYNGSFPGCLKHFIDLWQYPADFDDKKIAFCGLAAGMWGGLRPVEHLMGIFSYRETQLFYKNVYIANSYQTVNKDGLEENIFQRLKKQIEKFIKF